MSGIPNRASDAGPDSRDIPEHEAKDWRDHLSDAGEDIRSASRAEHHETCGDAYRIAYIDSAIAQLEEAKALLRDAIPKAIFQGLSAKALLKGGE